jgi:hypothetical protein
MSVSLNWGFMVSRTSRCCGVPSKEPDYLNQGIRLLLRNGSQLNAFLLQRSNSKQFLGNEYTGRPLPRKLSDQQRQNCWDSAATDTLANAANPWTRCLLIGTPRSSFRGITPIKKAIKNKQPGDEFRPGRSAISNENSEKRRQVSQRGSWKQIRQTVVEDLVRVS